ncbi:MAG: RNA-binding transcriptional accessory protein [Bacteroidales bacterium]|nr:RNA-binding transcriptional accessory protein [Bacteroidales bacterium]
MKEIYVQDIAARLSIKPWQVENCVELFADGATIPFVSRYRKERTGGLDEVAVAEIRHWNDVFSEMEKRKETILETISALGALTDELKKSIEQCVDSSELEDLYLPYKPKRRTRASIAKENGLEPLADAMWTLKLRDPLSEARRYVGAKVASADEALAGARDIIAERLSETAAIREAMRQIFLTRRLVCKKTKSADQVPEASKYRSYFDFIIPLQRVASHQLLAVLRAAGEGFLTLKIDADPEACGRKIYYEFSKGKPYPTDELRKQLNLAVEDAYKRLLEPSISGEALKICKQKADVESIRIFGENLRQLLLAPPVGGKRTMAIDPGFRTGCKVVCLDSQGNLLHSEAIFPHPPANEKVKSINAVCAMMEKYKPEVIAIGSGTAGRETEDFMKKIPMPEYVRVYSVSEDGASIYSASEVARKEFPDYDLTVRGAVSIGRRLMDPLSELVKIDPKSLGVGQYQHDVDQALLKEKLDNTVESCVNSVGVDLNTASEYLLAYVSGVGPSLASNIVEYRSQNGRYTSREQLRKVKRLGDKAFQQCAGFLRIPDATNPLDNSAVHPEAYHIVARMASDLGVRVEDLVSNTGLCDRIEAGRYVDGQFGLPTVNDIISELRKPSRDPREAAQDFSFADDIHFIDDLHPGMELPGIVTNITAFGAFVDIGVHENGLIHVSQMGRGVTDPSRAVHLHQKIKVLVLDVDLDRKRISLRLI